jgi:hypothetical protein
MLYLPKEAQLPGRDQLLLKSPELQSRLGQRYCDESELLQLLLSHGRVGRVRTIEVAVHPLGGDNFKIRLDAAKPSVGEAKAEIARVQGTEEARQELYRVEVRADGGGAVRKDDDEAEPLDEDGAFLGDGEVVAMAGKELHPFVWRTFAEDRVALSEDSGDSDYGSRFPRYVDNYGSGADRGQALLGSGAPVRGWWRWDNCHIFVI